MHDSLSISIYPSWLVVSPPSGHLMPGETAEAIVKFRAGNLPAGAYTGNIYLESNDPTNPSDTIPVTMNIVAPPCPYIPGDINGNGVPNGIDVVFGVNYFKGVSIPPISCDMCPEPSPFYAAGDVNGNCSFNGIDVTYFVRYLKGEVSALLSCSDCPPAPGAVPAAMPIMMPMQKVKSLKLQ